MPRFAANLSMMYVEHPFLERFAAAAADGFEAVEYLFPYEWPADTVAATLKQTGLRQVLFNAPPGDFARGRARHRRPARPRGRVPERLRPRPRVRRRPRLPAGAPDGRPRARRQHARGAAPDLPEESRVGGEEGRRRRHRRADRADQHPRHPRLLPQPPGRGPCRARRDRRAAAQGADGPLSLPDRRGRRRDQAAHLSADRSGRPPADRRRARAARARPRRGQLPLSVRRGRLARLGRLDRLRVPPGQGHVGRPRLAAPRAGARRPSPRRRPVLRPAPVPPGAAASRPRRTAGCAARRRSAAPNR